jgi:hypothetical protein
VRLHVIQSLIGHNPACKMLADKLDEHATSISSAGANGEVSNDSSKTGLLAKLRAFEATLDAKLGIESDAITRKLPQDKGPVPWHHQLTMFFLWASGTMNTSCFATGFLGWEFGLSKKRPCPPLPTKTDSPQPCANPS